jgi:predicted nucleic acid-binding protein
LVLAPELFVAEVGNALWKYVSSEQIERDEAVRLFFESRTLVDVNVAHLELADEAFAAAIQQDHPIYDLLYAILARRNAAAVMTMDRRLADLLARMDIEVVGVTS